MAHDIEQQQGEIMNERDLTSRIERLEKQVAWIVRQIRKILNYLNLNGGDGHPDE